MSTYEEALKELQDLFESDWKRIERETKEKDRDKEWKKHQELVNKKVEALKKKWKKAEVEVESVLSSNSLEEPTVEKKGKFEVVGVPSQDDRAKRGWDSSGSMYHFELKENTRLLITKKPKKAPIIHIKKYGYDRKKGNIIYNKDGIELDLDTFKSIVEQGPDVLKIVQEAFLVEKK